MTSPVGTSNAGERRLDLDWVRIIAFALLIFYHIACFYAPITPHNQVLSPRTIPWLVPPMLALSPWRLLILFVVAGVATRFMADKVSVGRLFRSRSVRLLIPLIFTVTIIAPPMAYFAIRQWFGFGEGFLAFLPVYFDVGRVFCENGTCVPTPSWMHLWFVAYLWLYTTALCLLLVIARPVLRGLQHILERALSGVGLILWPALYLVGVHAAMGGNFTQTGDVISDGHAHLVFFAGFLFGYLIAKSGPVWEATRRMRIPALIGAIAAYIALIAAALYFLGADMKIDEEVGGAGALSPARFVAYAIYGFDQWLWLVAALGFAGRYLGSRDSRARRYLTDAIFPFYIIHQLTIFVVGFYLPRAGLPLAIEAAVLVALTGLSCMIVYESARRVAWLGLCFGLKSRPSPARPAGKRAPA